MNAKTLEEIDDEVTALGDKVTTPQDQGMLIAAIKARYDLDELAGELTSNMLPWLYQVLALVPANHTGDNPMFQTIKRSKMNDTSGYYPGGSGVITVNAGETGPFSTDKTEDTDSAGKKLKLNSFDASTLHEVGHAVDDASGYMDAHADGPDYGAWLLVDTRQVAEGGVARLEKDWKDLGRAFLFDVAKSAVESDNLDNAIRRWRAIAKGALTVQELLENPAVQAADTIVLDLRERFTLPLPDDDINAVNDEFDLFGLLKQSPQKAPARNSVVNTLTHMKDYLLTADEAIKQDTVGFAMVDDPETIAKLSADILGWTSAIKNELCWQSSSAIAKVADNNQVFHQDRQKWWRYDEAARGKMVRDSQFRSPAEWFAEVYGEFMLGKLAPTYPCVDDIMGIDTTKKVGS